VTLDDVMVIARAANRADGVPDDDLHTARRLAAMLLAMVPHVSLGMMYDGNEWKNVGGAKEPPTAGDR
jgi:hypothetical protein